jgi:hypothetical protein
MGISTKVLLNTVTDLESLLALSGEAVIIGVDNDRC